MTSRIIVAAVAILAAGGLFFADGAAPEQTYFRPLEILKPSATILFGGDMMFDRSIRVAMEEKGGDFIFSCIDHVLRNADLVVANLEGPITSHASVSINTAPGGKGNYTFTFSTSTAETLARHNIRLVNIGNNHILNFGREGELSTIDFLEAAGVDYFGDPSSASVAHRRIRGIPFAFINYNEFAPQHSNILKNVGMSSTTIQQIKDARVSGEIPIIYTHWGDEYVDPPERVKQLARSFVDAGASIVIGSHPHIVQEQEMYGGKYIYYSVGNFIFDQYWNEEVRSGLLLKVTFNSAGVSEIQEIPIYLEKDRRTCAQDSFR